jgi:hypothetical protein
MHGFRLGNNHLTGNRRTFSPPALGAVTSTSITVYPGRELHDPSSIGLAAAAAARPRLMPT